MLWLLALAATTPQRPAAQLRYERGTGAERCIDVQQLEREVAARLGYEPFAAAATLVIDVRISLSADELVARIERRQAGALTGEREIHAAAGACGELLAALALAVSIAIDPLSFGRPVDPERAAEPPAPPPPPETPRSIDEPLRLQAGAGILGSIGAAPSATIGLQVGLGARRGSGGLGLEGRVDWPGRADVANGYISAGLYAASLTPCWHGTAVLVCGLLSGGALRGAGHELSRARLVWTPWAALGARLGAEVVTGEHASLRLQVDVHAVLISTILRVGGEDAWRSPPVSGSFGIAAVAAP